MDGKTSYIVPSVTTVSALEMCIRENVGLFAVEGPLFSMPDICSRMIMEGYMAVTYPEKGLIICRCIREGYSFDADRYDIGYYPLGWGGEDEKTPQPFG